MVGSQTIQHPCSIDQYNVKSCAFLPISIGQNVLFDPNMHNYRVHTNRLAQQPLLSQVLLDELVLPDTPIVNYNTSYSGNSPTAHAPAAA